MSFKFTFFPLLFLVSLCCKIRLLTAYGDLIFLTKLNYQGHLCCEKMENDLSVRHSLVVLDYYPIHRGDDSFDSQVTIVSPKFYFSKNVFVFV